MTYQQGEVYRYLPTENLGVSREGEYQHRALIVSSETYNRGRHLGTILFTTKKAHKNPLPTWVAFEPNPEFGLSEPCVAQCETLTRTPDRYLGERIGRISDEKMGDVVASIGCVMNAPCFLSE